MLESSSINFRGDLNPEIYVTVTRVISGVEARVSIFGPLKQPELRLASTPPLDQSDILEIPIEDGFDVVGAELGAKDTPHVSQGRKRAREDVGCLVAV